MSYWTPEQPVASSRPDVAKLLTDAQTATDFSNKQNSFWGTVKNTITGIPKVELNAAKDVVSTVKNTVNKAQQKVGDKAVGTVQNFWNSVTHPIDTAKGLFTTKLPGLVEQTPNGLKLNQQKAQGVVDTVAGLLGGEDFVASKSAGFDVAKYVKEQATQQKVNTPLGTKVKSFLSDIKAKLVDSNAPIEDILSKNLKENKISLLPKDDITNYIDRVYRAPTIAGQFAKDNGLEAVIRNVDNLDNLDQYMIAKQATDVNARGITTGRDLAKDKALIDVFAPKYEEQAKIVNTYSQKLLDYATESGLVSKDTATMLKERYPNYVPLQRVMDDIEQKGNGRAVASLSKQTVVQTIKGSTRQIESPIKSLLQKTNDVFVQGEKNKTAKLLASYEKLPNNPFNLKELTNGETNKNSISFLDGGVKRTFETTPEIASAAKALDVQQLGLLGKIFAFPVRIAKIGITGINLPFVASNIVRDQVSAFINSKNALRTSIVNPVNFVRALFSALKHDELYREMVRAGGGGTSFDIARNQIPESISRIRAGRNIASRVKYTVTHPGELLRAVENIIARSEELTRLQQFRGTKQTLLKQGLSDADATIGAARAARENTVNFSRSGEWGKVINSAFLYLNAGIQGSRTFLRTLATNPAGATVKIAIAVFMPSVTITAWNLSDPERKKAYEDIPEWEKEGNLIIVPPNPTQDASGKWNVIKIPLSQEVNNLANIPRRAIEQAYGLDPVKASEVASGILGSVSPINPTRGSIVSTLTPQLIKPSLEGITNTNLFTGYPEVSPSLQNLPVNQQVKKNTSGIAIKIANTLKLSPIKVEDFLKETFGGITPQILHAFDKIFTPNQVGGISTQDAIKARFTKATGGATENKQYNEFQKVQQEHSAKNAQENKDIKPIYDKIQELYKSGDVVKAQDAEYQLSDSQWEAYKRVRATDKKNQTTKLEQEMLPRVQEILQQVANGKSEEELTQDLTDEEYRVYKLVKAKLQ